MKSAICWTEEAWALLEETMQRLDARYDDACALLRGDRGPRAEMHDVRASAHYALGLLERGAPGDGERAERVIHAVLDTQYDAPQEIWHGTFRRAPEEPEPPAALISWKTVTPAMRYAADCVCERMEERLLARLGRSRMAERRAEVLDLLRAARMDAVPVVWKSYDPNWREFVMCAMAVVLALYEGALRRETAARIEHAARLAAEGAVARQEKNLTPLNSNIEIMHVFMCDFFGRRLDDAALSAHALSCAERFVREYRQHHAIHEFNSPTYCGVDLTALALWRAFSPTRQIRAMGEWLEAELWTDVAAFYHPLMQNLCGPFSRNYEMDMRAHTSFHALLYLGLGEARFPEHPFNGESDHNPLLVAAGVRIPDAALAHLTRFDGERHIVRTFQELSERGDPDEEQAVCTATAWLGRTLMTGALSGSRNVSGQLHPAVAYWRDARGGVSSMRLRRLDSLGENGFYHTVYLDARTERNRMTVDVRLDVERDMEVCFEFETDGIDEARFTPETWSICGLRVNVRADAPPFVLRHVDARHVRVAYPCPALRGRTLHFDMEFLTEDADG